MRLRQNGDVSQVRRTQEQRTAESTRRLVAAATELIAEKGFANTSAAQISARAGYSRSMVQFRWGTKEQMLESVLREEFETRLLPDVPDAASGLERVLHQIDHLDAAAAASPELMRAFFALCFEAIGPVPSLNSWITDWLGRYEDVTAAAIAAGLEDGSIRAGLDAHEEAQAFVASGLGHSFRWMAAPEQASYAELMDAWRRQVRRHLSP